MLTDLIGKIKSFIKENQKDLYLTLLVFVASVASFGLGRLSAVWPEKEPIQIVEPAGNDKVDGTANSSRAINQDDLSSPTNPSPQGNYVASKQGTYYHLPWCAGAKKIKDENKIWFQTKEEAEKAGYKPAGNCPGL